MRRYFAAGDASFKPAEDCAPVRLPYSEVHEATPRARPTGLLNAEGKPILVEERMAPIGFIHFGKVS